MNDSSYNISILIIDFIKYIIINKIELKEMEDVSSLYTFRLNSLLYIFQNKIVQVLPHHKKNDEYNWIEIYYLTDGNKIIFIKEDKYFLVSN